jgi:hypothetical protein
VSVPFSLRAEGGFADKLEMGLLVIIWAVADYHVTIHGGVAYEISMWYFVDQSKLLPRQTRWWGVRPKRI